MPAIDTLRNRAPRVGEERVWLHGVAWETYETLLADLADQSVPRLTYDDGTLEIMSPSVTHEEINRTLALLVEVMGEERGIDVRDVGSTTFRRGRLRRGFEADSAFYIQHEAIVRGRAEINLEVDPPPDLVIEIEIARDALPKLPIYAALGVPEVWRHDGQHVRIFILASGQYDEQPTSRAFPGVSGEALSGWVSRSRDLPRTKWLRDVRHRIRQR